LQTHSRSANSCVVHSGRQGAVRLVDNDEAPDVVEEVRDRLIGGVRAGLAVTHLLQSLSSPAPVVCGCRFRRRTRAIIPPFSCSARRLVVSHRCIRAGNREQVRVSTRPDLGRHFLRTRS